MQEETNSQQNRIQWTFYQILLMFLPGIIFLTLYPVNYRVELERAAQGIFQNPQSYRQDTMPGYCRFVAGLSTGMITVGGMVLCAIIVSFTQPTRRRMIRKALLALGFMTVVNIVFCGGGCAFGHHANSSLEDAIGRIKRTPVPATRAKAPAPQEQKP